MRPLALTLLLHTLPSVLAAPFGGWLADRVDRRPLLVAVAVLSAILTLAMALSTLDDGGGMAVIWLLLLVRSAVAAIAGPATTAAMPALLADDELPLGQTLLGTCWSLVFTLGMALGGLVAGVDVGLALALDAASFAFAAALLLRLPALPPQNATSSSLATAVLATARVGADEGGGDVVVALMRADVRLAVFAKTPLALAGGVGWMLLNVAGGLRLGVASAMGIGLLHAVRGIGTGVGPWFVARAVAAGASSERLWHGAGWLTLAGIAAFSLLTSAVLGRGADPAAVEAGGAWLAVATLVAATLWGCGTGSNWMLSQVALQRRAPAQALGRLAGIDVGSFEAAFCAGALAMALGLDAGLAPVAVALSVVGVAAVAQWLLWRPLAPSPSALASVP